MKFQVNKNMSVAKSIFFIWDIAKTDIQFIAKVFALVVINRVLNTLKATRIWSIPMLGCLQIYIIHHLAKLLIHFLFNLSIIIHFFSIRISTLQLDLTWLFYFISFDCHWFFYLSTLIFLPPLFFLKDVFVPFLLLFERLKKAIEINFFQREKLLL